MSLGDLFPQAIGFFFPAADYNLSIEAVALGLDVFLGFASNFETFCGFFTFFRGELDLFVFVGDFDFFYDFDYDLPALACFGVALLFTIFSLLSSCAALMRASQIILLAAGVSITYLGEVKSCLEVDYSEDFLSGVQVLILGDDFHELLGGDDPTSSLFASDLTESPAGVFTELLAGDDLPELLGPLRLVPFCS